jgi:hypothetical protein
MMQAMAEAVVAVKACVVVLCFADGNKTCSYKLAVVVAMAVGEAVDWVGSLSYAYCY